MRFKIGAALGFALGYYLGAKAGRERYEQLNKLVRRASRTELAQTAVDKARALGDLGFERARDLVHHNGGNGHPG